MLRTVVCETCGESFTYMIAGGPVRRWCPSCKEAREQAKNAARARGWRERNPERHREHLVTRDRRRRERKERATQP